MAIEDESGSPIEDEGGSPIEDEGGSPIGGGGDNDGSFLLLGLELSI